MDLQPFERFHQVLPQLLSANVSRPWSSSSPSVRSSSGENFKRRRDRRDIPVNCLPILPAESKTEVAPVVFSPTGSYRWMVSCVSSTSIAASSPRSTYSSWLSIFVDTLGKVLGFGCTDYSSATVLELSSSSRISYAEAFFSMIFALASPSRPDILAYRVVLYLCFERRMLLWRMLSVLFDRMKDFLLLISKEMCLLSREFLTVIQSQSS